MREYRNELRRQEIKENRLNVALTNARNSQLKM